MKITIILYILLLTVTQSYGQNLLLHKEIKLNTEELLAGDNVASMQFTFRNNTKTSFYNCISVMDVIEKHIKELDESTRKHLIFIAVSNDGQRTVFTFADISKSTCAIPAVFVLNQGSDTPKKTSLAINSKNQVEISENDVKAIKGLLMRTNVHLNIKNITKDEINTLMTERSILFLSDISTERWLPNIVSIEIYI